MRVGAGLGITAKALEFLLRIERDQRGGARPIKIDPFRLVQSIHRAQDILFPQYSDGIRNGGLRVLAHSFYDGMNIIAWIDVLIGNPVLAAAGQFHRQSNRQRFIAFESKLLAQPNNRGFAGLASFRHLFDGLADGLLAMIQQIACHPCLRR